MIPKRRYGIAILRFVNSQRNADLIYILAEAQVTPVYVGFLIEGKAH